MTDGRCVTAICARRVFSCFPWFQILERESKDNPTHPPSPDPDAHAISRINPPNPRWELQVVWQATAWSVFPCVCLWTQESAQQTEAFAQRSPRARSIAIFSTSDRESISAKMSNALCAISKRKHTIFMLLGSNSRAPCLSARRNSYHGTTGMAFCSTRMNDINLLHHWQTYPAYLVLNIGRLLSALLSFFLLNGGRAREVYEPTRHHPLVCVCVCALECRHSEPVGASDG